MIFTICDLRFTISKARLVLVLGLFLGLDARGQSYPNGVYADTNFVIAPGYTIPASQVTSIGAGIFGTNSLTLAQFVAATNSLGTNAANSVQACSNTFAAQFTWLGGTNNSALAGSNYNAAIGGNNNLWSAGISNSVIAGGHGNGISLYGGSSPVYFNDAQFIGGGISNRLSIGGASAIVGGQFNSIGNGGAFNCGIVAGYNNFIGGGNGNFILGGTGNYESYGGYSTNCGILGGRGNIVIGSGSGYAGIVNSLVAGVNASAGHNSVFIWSDDQPATFASAVTNSFLIRAANGVGINTNNPGTNALRVCGNLDATQISYNGADLKTLFDPTITSNYLVLMFNYNLNTASNLLETQLGALGADTTNQLNSCSNVLSAMIGAGTYLKALTATLPATYGSIGIGFSAPLMPDGNYSVALLPADQTTAESPAAGLFWWVDSKNASGFTIHASFPTNAYSLNFDCIVKENTQ